MVRAGWIGSTTRPRGLQSQDLLDGETVAPGEWRRLPRWPFARGTDLLLNIPKDLILKTAKLAVPVAGAYMVVVAAILAEYVIVEREVGALAIGAIGLAGTFCLVLVLSFHALEIASQAIVARRFGENRLPETGRCLDNSLLLAFCLGVPLTGALYFLGPILFRGAESVQIEELAIDYYHWRLPGIPFLIAILAMIGFFNGIGRPTVPMGIYGVVLVSNVVLCYGLVGGHWGLPAMGIAGAGLAQTISAVLGFVVFIIVLSSPHFRRRYHVFRFRAHLSKRLMGRLGKLAAPVFVQQFFTTFGMFLFAAINARVPDNGVSLTASTIARNIGYLTYLPSLGFGIAAATLVGQSLGAGNPRRAAQSGFVCWAMGAIFMVTMGILFMTIPNDFVRLLVSSGGERIDPAKEAKVIALAATLLIYVGGYQIFESINTIIGKALQGAGSTMTVMIVTVSAQWLLFLPLAWLLALPMELGARGAIIALIVQLMVISVIFAWKYLGGSWKRKVV